MSYRIPVINGGCPWANPQEHQPIPRRRVPNAARPVYEAHEQYARDLYGPESWEYPELSASKAVLMATPGLRDKATKGVQLQGQESFVMPNPGACILLAAVIEWTNLPAPVQLDTYRVDNDYTPLFWSPETKLLFADLRQGRLKNWRPPTSRNEKSATGLFEDFRWGQSSRGVTDIEVYDGKLTNAGVADTVLYRSGKGTDEMDDPIGVQEYIHQFGYGVHCYQDRLERPNFVCWRGGDLDVVKAGIVN